MPTQEDINKIQSAIIDEFKAIPDKLPWYWAIGLGIGAIMAFVGALAACGAAGAACEAASGGVFTVACIWAWTKCILAAIAVIMALVKLALDALGLRDELKKIEGKEAILEEMKAQLAPE